MHVIQRLVVAASIALHAAAITIDLPLSSPPGAPTISPSLISVSIEAANWPDWAGTDSPNEFTLNILRNLQKLTGTAPNIRVGGNSADRANFDPNTPFIHVTFPPPTPQTPFGAGQNITVGDGYYALARYMLPGTHMTFTVNWGSNNLTAATLVTQSLLKSFAPDGPATKSGVLLDLVEIGNEPDLYKGSKRPADWNISTYVSTWSNFSAQVESTVGLKQGGRPKVLGLSFAGSDHGKGGFSPQQAYADGILTSDSGKLINVISQHHYNGANGTVFDLLDKTTIRSNVTSFSPDINATTSIGLKYILGETNTYFLGGTPHVSDSGAAAIWTADYALFAGTQNISNVYFHQSQGNKYNMAFPIPLNISVDDASPVDPPSPPRASAPYYGILAVHEFLGKSSPRIVTELQTNSTTLGGYVLFNGGAAKRVLLINYDPWVQNSTGDRPEQSITLSGVPNGNMLVKRLSIPHADDQTGFTWGGQSIAYTTGKLTGSVQTETLNSSSTVNISSTELVLLTFQS